MNRSRRGWLAAAALVAGLIVLARVDAAGPPADATFAALVTEDAKSINKALEALSGSGAKAAKDKGADRGAVSAAVSTAWAAQAKINGGADDAKYATIRDSALKVAQLVKKGDYKEATEAAKGLTPDAKADPKANTKKVELHKAFDPKDPLTVDETMHLFKKSNFYGIGTEEAIKTAANPKSKLTPEQAAVLAARVYAIADHSKAVHGGKTGDKLTSWNKYNDDMEKATNDLTAAVKAGDKTKIAAGFKAVDGRCTACHNEFKK